MYDKGHKDSSEKIVQRAGIVKKQRKRVKQSKLGSVMSEMDFTIADKQ